MDKSNKNKIIRQWVTGIFKEEKSSFFIMAFWTIALSIINGAVVLILGPVLRTFFSDHDLDSMIELNTVLAELQKIIPENDISMPYRELIVGVPLCLIILGLLRSLILYFFLIAQEKFALKFTNNYRVKLFTAILDLPYLNSSRKSPAQWMSYLINDVEFIQTRVAELFKVTIKEATMVFGIVLSLIIIDFKTTIAILLLATPILLYGFNLGKKVSEYAKRSQTALSEISSVLGHLRKTFWFYRSQQGEEVEQAGFEKYNNKYFNIMKQSIFVRAILTPGLEFLGTTALCSVLIYYQFLTTAAQPEYIFQVILSMALIMKPLRSLGDQLAKFGELKGALSNTFSAITDATTAQQSEQSTFQDKADEKKSISLPVSITSLQLSLGDKQILNISDITLNTGDFIAIVGVSGSGKSSFMKTLAGLYTPDNYVASIPLKEISSFSSYVSQNPFFFSGTVRENLTYGSNTESLREDNFLNKLALPNNILDKEIGTDSKEVSQGQLQRLTISRGLKRNKSIYLFDEASSALDENSEEQAVNLIKDYTTTNSVCSLWITHRFELLKKFNKVWLVEGGEIREVRPEDIESLKNNI